MGAYLIAYILLREIIAIERLQLGQHAFLRAAHATRQLNLPSLRESLQFVSGLCMVGDHLARESLHRTLRLTRSELAGLDFKHIALGGFSYEIGRVRGDA